VFELEFLLLLLLDEERIVQGFDEIARFGEGQLWTLFYYGGDSNSQDRDLLKRTMLLRSISMIF
jgi:hypothetical protein